MTSTGNINSKQVQDALRSLDGDVVYIPLFDDTCEEDPGYDPETEEEKCNGGQGQNNWYHFVGVGAFRLCGGPDNPTNCTPYGSYLTGQNSSECDDNDPSTPSGSGGTSCLVGTFVEDVYQNTTVGPLYDPGDPTIHLPRTSSVFSSFTECPQEGAQGTGR